jgi:TPR repeat protein
VARLYATGRGLPQSLVEAASWHLLAAAQGLADPWLDQALRNLSTEDRARAERLAADRSGAT